MNYFLKPTYDRNGEPVTGLCGQPVTSFRYALATSTAIAACTCLTFAYGSWYMVPEGHVGVVKHFGKAVEQTDPGIHIKWPLVDQISRIEVRQKKSTETLTGASKNQLPLTAKVSINWTVDKNAAMELYIKYGGLNQFYRRMIAPQMQSSGKAAFGMFDADLLITQRNLAVVEIMKRMVEATEGLPVTINSPQIENITLPKAYLGSVEEKEKAKQDALREKHNLAKQKLVAEQLVQTAEANNKAVKLAAEAKAYKLVTEATAEAKAIKLVNSQLAKSQIYIELVKAKAWDGKWPTTVAGELSSFLFNVK